MDVSTNSAGDNISATVTSFNSNGFSLGSESWVNASGGNFVSYTFRKCPGFFDMVQYTGNGTGGRTVSHNLGGVPGVVIVKNTTSSSNWQTHFTARGTNSNFPLNNTGTESNADDRFIRSADATTITLGDDWDTNRNSDTYIAFIFAHNDASFGDDGDEAIIKCGYTVRRFRTRLDLNLSCYLLQQLVVKIGTFMIEAEGLQHLMILKLNRQYF